MYPPLLRVRAAVSDSCKSGMKNGEKHTRTIRVWVYLWAGCVCASVWICLHVPLSVIKSVSMYVICVSVSAVCVNLYCKYAWLCVQKKKKSSYYTDFCDQCVITEGCVQCSVQAGRKHQICKWVFFFFFPQKIQSANTNRQKNTQAQQNWQSFIKMTQNWTASSETTWNNLPRKHIHIWNPSFWALGVHIKTTFCLCQLTRGDRLNFKLSCNWDISTSWLLKV